MGQILSRVDKKKSKKAAGAVNTKTTPDPVTNGTTNGTATTAPTTVETSTSTMALPPIRRIVTGHSPEGKAIIASDTTMTPLNPVTHTEDIEKGGFTLLFRTIGFPATLNGPWEDFHGKDIPLADKNGTTLRMVDMPPGLSSPMHRTISIDFGVVLEGEVVLELDDGVEVTMKRGDVEVQRGTIHAWHNRGATMCRILFVLVPSENPKVESTGEVLEATKFEIN